MPFRTHPPVLALLGLLIASMPAAAAYSCQAKDPGAGGDPIDLSSMPLGDPGAKLPQPALDAIGRMQSNNVGNGLIVDKLVAAYCRRVSGESGMADKAKAAAVERFAAHVAQYVYSTPSSNEEDILVDVPVPTNTFDAITAAAKKANMSQDTWINAAIRSKLAAH